MSSDPQQSEDAFLTSAEGQLEEGHHVLADLEGEAPDGEHRDTCERRLQLISCPPGASSAHTVLLNMPWHHSDAPQRRT